MVLLEGAWIVCHGDQAIMQDWELSDVETPFSVQMRCLFVIISSFVSPSLLTAAPGPQVHLLQLTKGEVHNLLGQVIASLHHTCRSGFGGGGGGGEELR